MLAERIDKAIRNVPDFPKPGIQFKDITPIFQDQILCSDIVDAFAAQMKGKVDAVCGVESRGFIFGMMLANQLNVPFVIARKQGKLPAKTVAYSYDLEYGSATLEMHVDSIKLGARVWIHDDLLATGGTAASTAELVKMQGGVPVGFAFLVGLSFLNGTQKLAQYNAEVVQLVEY